MFQQQQRKKNGSQQQPQLSEKKKTKMNNKKNNSTNDCVRIHMEIDYRHCSLLGLHVCTKCTKFEAHYATQIYTSQITHTHTRARTIRWYSLVVSTQTSCINKQQINRPSATCFCLFHFILYFSFDCAQLAELHSRNTAQYSYIASEYVVGERWQECVCVSEYERSARALKFYLKFKYRRSRECVRVSARMHVYFSFLSLLLLPIIFRAHEIAFQQLMSRQAHAYTQPGNCLTNRGTEQKNRVSSEQQIDDQLTVGRMGELFIFLHIVCKWKKKKQPMERWNGEKKNKTNGFTHNHNHQRSNAFVQLRLVRQMAYGFQGCADKQK